jgi:hypothetical protein
VVSEIRKQLQPDKSKEYKAAILSLISKLEDIQKAYNEGDIEKCNDLIDIGETILASFNVEDDNTKFLQSQFSKWTKTLSNNH